MTQAARLRILLLALGVTAIAGALYWPESRVPEFRVSNFAFRDTPQTAVPVPVEQDPESQPLPRTLSDSEFTEKLDGYGLVVMQRSEYESSGDDTGSFYFVTRHDSTRTLRDLGFIRGRLLLDSGSRFSALGDSGAVPQLELAARQLVDSQLRQREDGCILEVATPLRRIGPGDRPWLLAVAGGGAEPIPPSVWNVPLRSADSSHLREALRLINLVPIDSADAERLASVDTLFAGIPFRLARHYRFTLDGAEIVVADAQRDVQRPYESEGETYVTSIEQQRVIIAERDAGDRTGAFRIVWSWIGGGSDDDVVTETPALVLRLGRERLLTVYTAGDYKEGMGGRFVSRIGKGRWREVASWVSGC